MPNIDMARSERPTTTFNTSVCSGWTAKMSPANAAASSDSKMAHVHRQTRTLTAMCSSKLTISKPIGRGLNSQLTAKLTETNGR